ncbi:pseudouridine synthase [Anaerobranca gottschalkii]|uniref:Pseudouridine synthase n=1 Tax=Anaerobranca gottschalkii DSM 13577 TaxID=1120990 RepID=A0A1I0BUU4_9FIRM|nr:pseudouridine synthase [Anaerobranca gottschalkii]SET10746.1 16S rRNA pseudouridine516 synthase [Anaerobranca gottschalkii DSM 13577]
MGKKMRLDKVLANMGFGSRKDIKKLVKAGKVSINGELANDPSAYVDPYCDEIILSGKPVIYKEFIYIMMNKPPGVLSATEDDRDPVVVDLLKEEDKAFKPFPVGRLDKDTEGLLLLTNDGKLAHKLTSPKKKVPKIYYADVLGEVTQRDVEIFSKGVTLDDGYRTMPGQLEIIKSGEISQIQLTIYEGKFHQVKRMFQAVGKRVIYLKRIAMGDLKLDENLKLGQYRHLTEEELALLTK